MSRRNICRRGLGKHDLKAEESAGNGVRGFPLNRLPDYATESAMKLDFSTVWSRWSSRFVLHRICRLPDKPVLEDAKKLYAWTSSEFLSALDDGTQQFLPDGPPIEIVGELPTRLPQP